MEPSVLKHRIGIIVAAAPVIVAIIWWISLNVNGAMGNEFTAGTLSRQFLLYGRLAGILMAFAFLFQLLSMGKGRFIEQAFPKASLVKIHRWLGFATIGFLILHLGLIFGGRVILHDDSFLKVCRDFFFDGKWGSLAGLGFLLLIAVLTFCALFIMKKMKYPAWKKTHYFTYAVVLFFFFHQIFYGLDFAKSAAFKYFWIAIFAIAVLDVIVWKLNAKRSAKA